jgi:hypothetical protein
MQAARLAAQTTGSMPSIATAGNVELAGNAFITQAPDGASVGSGGLVNWSSYATVASIWCRVNGAGPVTLALDARLVGGNPASLLTATVNGQTFYVRLGGSGTRTYSLGTVQLAAPGYVRVDLRGVSKGGAYFGEVSALKVQANAPLAFASDPASYYWSRRGPSVHLWYTVPANTEYFYNEVTVPGGQDPAGSFYMANGFNGGYFGLQVKSASERWVLFSVWDADNGGKATLVGKGPGVVDNSFGGEGTGGQAYLSYNWISGLAYRFITQVRPDGAGGTDYSAWFYAPEAASWRYIATWKRPATSTYHNGVYSFLENFIDTNGYLGRRAQYGNQWARSTAGAWSEVRSAYYTGDATANSGQRLDYAGGVSGGRFYLRNGGFFSDYVPLNQGYTRPAGGTPPAVNVAALPR